MKKQIFQLRDPENDPYQIVPNGTPDSKMSIDNEDVKDDAVPNGTLYDPSQHLILWSIRLFDHILIMPELTLLVQEFYCFN